MEVEDLSDINFTEVLDYRYRNEDILPLQTGNVSLFTAGLLCGWRGWRQWRQRVGTILYEASNS